MLRTAIGLGAWIAGIVLGAALGTRLFGAFFGGDRAQVAYAASHLPAQRSRLLDLLTFYGVLVLFNVAILIGAGIGLGVGVYCRATGKPGLTGPIAGGIFSRIACTLIGVDVEIEGSEFLDQNRPCVFVLNHQASLDVLVGATFFPRNSTLLVKESLFYVPVFGQWLWLIDTIFVNRGNKQRSALSVKRASEIMKQKGLALIVFAEGTRNRSTEPSLLPFKRGAFTIAVEGAYPIVPVVIQNYSHVYNSVSKTFRGGLIRARALPPIPTVGVEAKQIDGLVDTVRSTMLEELVRISGVDKKAE